MIVFHNHWKLKITTETKTQQIQLFLIEITQKMLELFKKIIMYCCQFSANPVISIIPHKSKELPSDPHFDVKQLYYRKMSITPPEVFKRFPW